MLKDVQRYLELERELGPYEAEAAQGAGLVEAARDGLAGLLGTERARIALFDNATRAWTTLIGNLTFHSGDVVWVSQYEYTGNLFFLAELRRRIGIEIVVMPCTEQGDLDLAWAANHLTDDVVLVCAPHVPSCCGVVLDVGGLGALVAGSKALFAIDGCQAVGNLPVAVEAIGCDIYTAAGRKFLSAPRGTAFAYVSAKYLNTALPQAVDVHAMTVSPGLTAAQHISDAAGFELAERNIALWAGLRTAVEEHRAHSATYQLKHELFLCLENDVCALPGITRLGEASRRSGIVGVMSSRVPVRDLHAGLAKRGVRAWVGLGEHTPLFAPAQGADEFLRLSVGPDLTRSSIDKAVQALADLLG